MRRVALLALAFALVAPSAAARPLTKKERQKRQQEEAAKKEQDKKDEEAAAAAAAEDERKKKEAAAVAPTPAPAGEETANPGQELAKAVFIAVDLGYTRPDMSTFAASSMAFDHGSANGLLIGLAGGLRLREWQFGLRYRIYDASSFTLWSFSTSAAYALSYRPITPIIEAHLGYVFDQSIDTPVFKKSVPEGTILPPDVNVKGVLVGGELSGNYWLTSWFRAGLFLGADVMFLSRERAPLPQTVSGPTPEVAPLPLYSDSGFGVGLNVNLGLRGSFDIGIE